MSKEKIFILLSFTALALFAYRDCFDILIPGENFTFMYMYENHGASAIMKNARVSGPHFVTFSVLYLLYIVFGINAAYWMLSALLLHILNSFLIYVITRRLLATGFFENEKAIAFFSGLLFLISPYQTEDVLWTFSSITWLFHALVTLGGIYLLFDYFANPSQKKIAAIHSLFLLGLFSYEFTLISPLIYIVFFILFRKAGAGISDPKKFFTQLIFPQAAFILAYFFVCKLVNGHWFWHAGTFNDITQTTDYAKTFLKYLAKFFIFYRYLPFEEFDTILRSLSASKWLTAFAGGLTLIIVTIYFWLLNKAKSKAGYIVTVLFACFIISLLPMLPLDSSFVKYIYPDRYGYLPSFFFYVFLVCTIFFLFKKIAFPILTVYSIICFVLLVKTIPVWSAANEHCNALTINYKQFQQYEKVYVLNVPTYYEGVAAFRSSFAETVFMRNNSPVEKIHVVSGCYQESASDTIKSVIIKGNTVSVSGPKKQTPYFSTDGGWAKSYETDRYSVIFDTTGCSYTLVFKQEIPKNSAFIYTSGNTWRKAG